MVLVRHLSSTTDICLWFASHGVVTLCYSANNKIRYYSILFLWIICNNWSSLDLLFNQWIAATCLLLSIPVMWSFSLSPDHCDFSKCMFGSVNHSPHSLTSFPCHTSHRSRLANQPLPLRSVVSIEPCEVWPVSLAIALDHYLHTEWPWSSELGNVHPTQH